MYVHKLVLHDSTLTSFIVESLRLHDFDYLCWLYIVALDVTF